MTEEIHTNVVAARAKKKVPPVRPHLERALKDGDPQAVIDALTGKQKAFVEEYLKDLNGTQAVLRCGYKTAHPNRIATRLLANPGVRFAIDALKAQRAENSDVTSDYVLKEIVKVYEAARTDNDHNPSLRALELLAKHLGMFVERREISGPDGEAIKYEQKISESVQSFTSQLDKLRSVAKDRKEDEDNVVEFKKQG